MKNIKRPTFNFAVFVSALAILTIVISGCHKNNVPGQLRDFQQVNLVDNNGEYNAAFKDTSLQNAWGLAFSPTGIAWVNSQAGHVSALYDQTGKTVRAAVNIPSPADTIGGNPTGIIFNSSTEFLLSNGKPAAFIFVGVDGVVSAWNGPAGNNAFVIANNVSTSSYTGLEFDSVGSTHYIYAANFRAGSIDVWNGSWAMVSMNFKDPGLPAGFAPFNIQAVDNWLVVTYAKVGPDGRDEAGQGLGYVSVFNPDGSFVERFASGGTLNAPWGIVKAPVGFFDDNDGDDNPHNGNDDNHNGKHGSQQAQVLIGNFGDGRINAYTMDGNFLGQIRMHNHPLTIEGLWALSFAPSTATAIDPGKLFFTAGPDDEKDGLFGYIQKN